MPEIEIRPAEAADIPALIELDHTYQTEYVWQMEFQHNHDEGQIQINFRKVRLPRLVRSDYPHPARTLADIWPQLSGLLVATLDTRPIGYTSLVLDRVTSASWVTDLVVDRPLRRKGVGSALLFSAAKWASTKESRDLVLEMQPKNGPAISLALKLGFTFCGYNDFHYPVNEVGVFFRKSVYS